MCVCVGGGVVCVCVCVEGDYINSVNFSKLLVFPYLEYDHIL